MLVGSMVGWRVDLQQCTGFADCKVERLRVGPVAKQRVSMCDPSVYAGRQQCSIAISRGVYVRNLLTRSLIIKGGSTSHPIMTGASYVFHHVENTSGGITRQDGQSSDIPVLFLSQLSCCRGQCCQERNCDGGVKLSRGQVGSK